MKSMKFLLISLFVSFALSCNAGDKKESKSQTVSSDKIEVYYFHFTARCVTCKTLEAEAQKDIKTLYPELYNSGKITFKSINLTKEEGKQLAEKLNVSGQTLLITKGDKQINITNDGFMYCRSNPKKFKAVIKEKVDSLL